MHKDELATILEKHAKWLRGEDDGARANLESANLARANLESAYLAGANLESANLESAYLEDAYLEGARTQHNKFILSCSLGNYALHVFLDKSGVRVTAGCRMGMTIEQAREHWSPQNMGGWNDPTEAYGKRQLAMLDFLVAQAKELGWGTEEISEDAA